jgi:hypothetical protein
MTIGLLAIVAIALFAAGFAQLLAPIERPDPERQFLSAEQRELADRVRESSDFVSEQQRLMDEIAGLQAKMREVDPELDATGRGFQVLDIKQGRNTAELARLFPGVEAGQPLKLTEGPD